jgi:DNA-binding transcriptional regulator YiaG
MANIQQLLNDEIRRLARKETSGALKDLKAQLVELRKTVAELNRRLKALEKEAPVIEVVEKDCTADEAKETAKALRVTPQRITKWRTALGLNKSQYAELLGVNLLSVLRWESGKSTPRDEQKRRIVAVRDMGKRELAKLMAEKNITVKNQ